MRVVPMPVSLLAILLADVDIAQTTAFFGLGQRIKSAQSGVATINELSRGSSVVIAFDPSFPFARVYKLQ